MAEELDSRPNKAVVMAASGTVEPKRLATWLDTPSWVPISECLGSSPLPELDICCAWTHTHLCYRESWARDRKTLFDSRCARNDARLRIVNQFFAKIWSRLVGCQNWASLWGWSIGRLCSHKVRQDSMIEFETHHRNSASDLFFKDKTT